MSQPSLLELTHEYLFWPHPDDIWSPKGESATVYAKLAEKKIGEKLKRTFPDQVKGIKISVLTGNPDKTEAPIALICEFPRPIPEEIFKEIYRLAWNFSRTRALIIVEPHLLRVLSCCEPPEDTKDPEPITRVNRDSLSQQAANALQWIELVSGDFFEDHKDRFQRSGAADQKLLENLKAVRKMLIDEDLDKKIIHDLIARLIFIQYLFDKKDDIESFVITITDILQYLTNNSLSQSYDNLPDILGNIDNTYQLFRCLNHKFNGDLFPGKGQTEEEKEREWQLEKEKVREKEIYLSKLADFIRGDLDIETGQLSLWPMYSFDVIPLEFISSIYEEFVSKKTGTGVHYTPEFIVDFILDGVLPWDDEEWDLKILDPACGSGIFLVKAYQRLIYRWEKAHQKTITPDILKSLLENNFFGVDIDEEAVRVASLSFYLMMLDHIKPKNYWENDVKFPILRGKKLIAADFFREDIEGFRTEEDSETYDLVLGNAPWGRNTITETAKAWTQKYNWNDCIAYGNIAPFFLAKSVKLTKNNGYISMMQPAGALIFNQGEKNQNFRFKLFSDTKLDEIVDLSALRFGLFKNAISPSCLITLQNISHNNEPFLYLCPKILYNDQDNYSIVLEPQNIHWVQYYEILRSSLVLITLTWGNRRDFHLIKRLSQGLSLSQLEQENRVYARQGVKRGNRKKIETQLLGRRILKNSELLSNAFLYIKFDNLPINNDSEIDSGTSIILTAFSYPQMILKQSWIKKMGRFRSAIIQQNSSNTKGILCSESYVSVHSIEGSILESAWLSYNSILAVYYLLLSSGRFASYIHEIKPNDLLKVPISEPQENILEGIETYDDVDNKIRELFKFKDSEWALIEDLFNYTLPDFKGDSSSPGRQPTQRQDEPELTQYCDYFIKVIKASFGQDKAVCATIYQEPDEHYLPVRLVAIHLNHQIHEGIKIERIDSQQLLRQLDQLNQTFLQQSNEEQGGIYYQRVARIYQSVTCNNVNVPTVYFIKPDKIRYWTRSMGLRDADEVGADIMIAGQQIHSTNDTLDNDKTRN